MAGRFDVNIPIEFLIEDSDISLTLIYVVPGMSLPPVPDHDLAIVLVCDGEAARPVLNELARIVDNWPRHVLNDPQLVQLIGRDSLCKLLAHRSDIEIPSTILITREQLCGLMEGPVRDVVQEGDFPLIIRPVDSHAGHGLAKINSPNEIGTYVAENPEEQFFLSRFVDYRNADGLFRKYRIAVIDGEAYPCHMAISENWMIHFINAGMIESTEKRSEEQKFMDTFREGFGKRHAAAIKHIAEVSGLEYFGIDCAEMPDGRLLVFEADTAMVVHNLDDPSVFPYKGEHMLALFDAFRDMLYRYAGKRAADQNQADRRSA